VISEQVELFETITGEYRVPPPDYREAAGGPGEADRSGGDVLPFRRSDP
jgi:hypothetical protein